MQPVNPPLLLLVDDDPDQLALLRLAVLRAGVMRCVGAESAREALIFLQARESMGLPPPDLVLTDLKMPGMSGVDLMHALRARSELRQVPVLFMTSSGYRRDRDAAQRDGADGYFQKPMNFADLVAIMKSLPAYLPVSSEAESSADSHAVSATR